MKRSCQFAMNSILNYEGALEPHFVVSFAEVHIKDIVVNMLSLRYLRKQLRLFDVRYVRFGRSVAEPDDVLPLLRSLKEVGKTVKSCLFCI